MSMQIYMINRHLEYERVYMSLYKVADTPFHIQGNPSLTCKAWFNVRAAQHSKMLVVSVRGDQQFHEKCAGSPI